MVGYVWLAAVSGWLLVAPGFNVDAPLDRWKQVQAFDTAKECEVDKDLWWSQALEEVEKLLPYPPLPKAKAPAQGQAAPKDKKPPQKRPTLLEEIRTREQPSEPPTLSKSLIENIRESLDRDIPLPEPTPPEWRKEADKIDAARELKRREVNERYRPWKCVPADAVYRGVK